jgi:uncharacterized damage-inducible protein DinB
MMDTAAATHDPLQHARTTVLPGGDRSHAARGVAAMCTSMLDQCAAFVAALPDGVFTANSTVLAGGTIGKHVRHSLDHFAAALAGAGDGLSPGTLIEYDRRQREVPVEVDRAVAKDAALALSKHIGALPETVLSGPARIRMMLSSDGVEAELQTTLARELAFAAHHAIHHHAMIKAIAAEFGVQSSPDFGKAPSTLRFEATAPDRS